MKKYICDICAYEYKAEQGDSKSNIKPETKWEELPESYKCPVCGGEKKVFLIIEQDEA